MSKFLIVNADDFGASEGINRGIIECHSRGVVTSASLMVTGSAMDEAVVISRDYPSLSIGLHWDVWGERERAFDVKNLPAVRDEFFRQLDLFDQKMGSMPTHIDSHQHAHIDSDRVVFDFFQELVKPLNVPLRGGRHVFTVLEFYGRTPPCAHDDVKKISVPFLQKIIRQQVHEGWTEIMCHPGYVGPGYESLYSKQREVEIQTLTDPRIRRAIFDDHIQLATYKDFKSHGGMNIRPEAKLNGSRETYFRLVWNSINDIKRMVPEAKAFILVDGETLGVGEMIAGRRKIPFPEKNGLYWGPPADSKAAIEELQRLQRKGAGYLVIASPAFWWLEYYEGWFDYLCRNARCLMNNKRVYVFKLSNRLQH